VTPIKNKNVAIMKGDELSAPKPVGPDIVFAHQVRSHIKEAEPSIESPREFP
jgi:hypothetical protein